MNRSVPATNLLAFSITTPAAFAGATADLTAASWETVASAQGSDEAEFK